MNTVLRIAGLFIAAACVQVAAAAEPSFPGRPVRLIVPFPPGGGTDILARPLAQKLTEKWSYSVVVDNRGGAGGNIGTKAAAEAEPDGYTLILGVLGTHAVNQSLYAHAGFDSTKDFAAITMVANTPNILVVHPSVPARSVKELIAYAKANPGKLNYASPGNGTPSHLATEMFKKVAGVDLTHVPYKGSGPAIVDMLSGRTQLWIANAPVVLQHIKAGKLRALATTSERRPAVANDVPTLNEAGLAGYEADTWYGLFAPAKTAKPVLEKIHADVVAVLRSPGIREIYAAEGAEVVANSSEEFTRKLRADVAKWKKVIANLNLRVD